jgi:hypothetical protein
VRRASAALTRFRRKKQGIASVSAHLTAALAAIVGGDCKIEGEHYFSPTLIVFGVSDLSSVAAPWPLPHSPVRALQKIWHGMNAGIFE